jgi:hypothetical protein
MFFSNFLFAVSFCKFLFIAIFYLLQFFISFHLLQVSVCFVLILVFGWCRYNQIDKHLCIITLQHIISGEIKYAHL